MTVAAPAMSVAPTSATVCTLVATPVQLPRGRGFIVTWGVLETGVLETGMLERPGSTGSAVRGEDGAA